MCAKHAKPDEPQRATLDGETAFSPAAGVPPGASRAPVLNIIRTSIALLDRVAFWQAPPCRPARNRQLPNRIIRFDAGKQHSPNNFAWLPHMPMGQSCPRCADLPAGSRRNGERNRPHPRMPLPASRANAIREEDTRLW
jgi:hypothetical protein